MVVVVIEGHFFITGCVCI